VDEGGALVYLRVGGTDYLFALLGNSNRFRRYSISGNNWSNLANTPANVKKGGSMTTDGTYIYALQGGGAAGFWRCNATTTGSAGSCDTSWTTLTNIPTNVGWGGALTYLNDYIYALMGNNTKKFYRYGPLSGAPTWSDAPADTPGNVQDGGALTHDGTYIYAFQGKTNVFWRYSPSANTWTARANALGSIAQGGALVFVPGTGSVDRQTTLDATPTLVSTGTPISVTMALLSNTGTVTNVVPSSPLTVTASGASAVCAGPIPASQTVVSGTVATYKWNCALTTTGTAAGIITFTASASGFGGVQFAAASSNNVIVVPALTFRATVNNPPGVNTVDNLATLIDGSGALPPKPSNTTSTAVTGNLGDFVWADLDGDGVQDAGEPGLSGIQVCAAPVGGGTTVCAVTDAFGAYRIYGLSTSTAYTVTLTPATIPAGYAATTPASLTRTPTVAGVNDADFGLQPPGTATIGDTVWLDRNNNGSLDGSEAGLPGVTVRLYDSAGATLLATTTTNASGVYTFTGLNPAAYQVRVDTNSVVTTTYGIASTLGAAMTATTGTVNPRTVTITTPGQAITNADFGYNWSGSIGDYVWYDDNLNGVPDEGAGRAIAGATVLLYYDRDGDGVLDPSEYTPVRLMDTNASGIYTFNNLPPGRYLVDVYEDSFTVDGHREAIPTTPDVRVVNLAAGQTVTTADFGYYNGALIEGHVFWDADRNGIFDGTETGLTPVGVTLTGFDNFGNPVSASTTTDAGGKFAFLVPEGTYTITYSTPNVLAIDPTLRDATTPTSYTVTAEAGPDWHVDLLFGVDNSGRIGDTIWNDSAGASADGVYSPTLGETGLANVTINLFDSTGALIAADMTDANGNYLFEGLANGVYTVSVVAGTIPAGLEQTGDPDQPGVRCTAGACDNRTVVTLTDVVTQVLTADFGYRYSSGGGQGLTTLRGYVYQDLAADGSYAAGTDPLISAATIRVSCGVSGTFQTTTTAGGIGGNWNVAGVPEGATCSVTVVTATLPSPAYVQTGDPDQPGVRCTAGACDSQYTLTVPAGGATGINFGYNQQLGGIGGTVVIGPNANGIADPGETPLGGVTITLLYAGTDGLLGTGDDTTTITQTNASGVYSFTNLLPGLYQVVETNLPTYLSVADRDGGNPDNITVNLTTGQHVAGRDFEDAPPPSLAVNKALTTPAGGVAAVGDTITFTLRITNTGAITLTALTITDAYDASKLTPTGYSVTPNGQTGGIITWTTNLTPSLPLAAGAGLALTVRFRADAITMPGVTTNTLTVAGQDVFGQPAGPLTGQATVQIQPAATGQIGDRVWWDINGNGSQDADEPGIAGVDLLLNGGTVTTTSGAGVYLFSPLAAGTYTVTIAPTEFQPGGTLYNWVATAPVGLVHTFTITQSQVITTADFGLNIASSYTVTKQLVTLDPVRPGEPISFTIRVTNTGVTWLAALPMQDAYNNTFLTYGFSGDFAALVDSDDHTNDGVLNWTDALSVTRGGPGMLAPGASTAITVWFTAREDTQTESSLGTANRITVTTPAFDPDGAGPLPAGATQPGQGATAYVRIYRPTGLTVVGFRATAEKGRVTLTWQTANEAQILGFNILRRVSNGPAQPINQEIIPAEHAGASQGATYTFTDQPAAGAYAYLLEVIQADGHRIRTNPTVVRIGP
jgi:uncharacterized repeat protein (TIGR01451 family)